MHDLLQQRQQAEAVVNQFIMGTAQRIYSSTLVGLDLEYSNNINEELKNRADFSKLAAQHLAQAFGMIKMVVKEEE